MIIKPPVKTENYGVEVIGKLTEEQCDQIIEMHSSLEPIVSRINNGDETVVDDTRTCTTYLPRNAMINDMLLNIGAIANNKYTYDVTGLIEEPQLLKYETGTKYGWHIDTGINDSSTRKISISIILNGDYEGGELCFFSDQEYSYKFERGDIVTFPSFISHTVKPVTSGIRWSIVGWIAGHPFR